MATCAFHHTYKVVYELRESTSGRFVEYVEEAMEGLARQKVINEHGGPTKCAIWECVRVD